MKAAFCFNSAVQQSCSDHHLLIASAKEVMFYLVFVFLFVCLSVCYQLDIKILIVSSSKFYQRCIFRQGRAD